MELLNASVLRTLTQGRKAIDSVLKGKFEHCSIQIDCKKLAKFEFVKESPYLPKFLCDKFPETITEAMPAIYFFRIEGGLDRKTILEAYHPLHEEHRKDRQGSRAIHALKKFPPHNTDYLYVGKVKRNLRSRLGIHVGCYEVNRTAGLQLRYWAAGIKLKLSFNVFAFPEDLAPFVDGLELALSKELNPMIGKQ